MKRTFAAVMALALLLLAACGTPAVEPAPSATSIPASPVDLITPGDGVRVDCDSFTGAGLKPGGTGDDDAARCGR